MDSTVSVCIPAYRGKFLAKTIESILNQTRKVEELIIIDDYSPDDLESIVASYHEGNIHYIRNASNYGVPYIYNYALKLTTSNYVLIFGDHDIMEPSFIEKSVALFDKDPEVSIVFSAAKAIDEQDRVVVKYPKDLFPEIFPGKLLERWLVTKIASPLTLDTFIRKSALENCEVWFDPKYWWYADIDLWIRLAHQRKVGYVNEHLLRRRFREKGHFLEDKVWESLVVCDRIRLDDWHLAYPQDNIASYLARVNYEYRKNLAVFKILVSLKAKSETKNSGVLPEEALNLLAPGLRWIARLFVVLPSGLFKGLIRIYRRYFVDWAETRNI
jgi:glycosyltransferase involved in cell wall biosynthesis